MTRISQRLEHIVRKELLQNPIPVRTTEGILVGDILIQSQGHMKNLLRGGEIVYREIHLNAVAIRMANLLCLRQSSLIIDRIYAADQDYGRVQTYCGLGTQQVEIALWLLKISQTL